MNKYQFLGRDITDDDNHVAPASGVRAFAMFLSGLENYQKIMSDLPNLVENHGAKSADHDDHRDDNDHESNHRQCNHLRWNTKMMKYFL